MTPQDFLIIIVIAIGIVHGGTIARALRSRFPSFKTHAKFASLALLLLFSINSILAVSRLAQPPTLPLSSITSDNLPQSLVDIIGVDGGFASTLAVSVTVLIFVLMRLVKIEGILRYFVLAVSVSTVLLGLIYRFAGSVPDLTQILYYAMYHVGFNAGMFVVLSRECRIGRAVMKAIKSGLHSLFGRIFDGFSSKFRI